MTMRYMALIAFLGTVSACARTTHNEGGPHGPLSHRFEDAEQWAKKFDDPGRDTWQRPADVIALMDVPPGTTVVDLGAGTGYFLRYLSRAVGITGVVLALDVEPDMVRYLSERAERESLHNVRAMLVPVDDPRLPEGGVDRILVVNTWHHIADRSAYAEKLARSLKPGGTVFVVDFTLQSKKGPPRHHRLAPEEVAAELQAAELEAQVLQEPLPEQYVVVGTLP